MLLMYAPLTLQLSLQVSGEILSALVAPAEAAVTGSIRGHVQDDQELPVPGAVVRLSGEGIAGEMSVSTDEDGNFVFPSVPVGTHTLQVSGPGLTPIKTTVRVRLDQTTTVPVTLQVAGAAEIEVVTELPVIDTTQSSFSSELSEEVLHTLPTGRSYQDAVNMLPGISGRVDTSQGGPGDGNPSVRGEGQYGNNYTLDGISTRDPATKTFGSNVPFDVISDIQVYTDGAPAEFGQATGMLVNVVTKDGGDEHFGSAWYGFDISAGKPEYMIADLAAHEEVATPSRDFMAHSLSLTAGGPVTREKLWYLLSLDLGTDSTAYEGSDTTSQSNSLSGFGKLTWFVTPDLSVQYQMSGSALSLPNSSLSYYTEEAQSNESQSEITHMISLRWRPDAMSELQWKGLFSNSSIDAVPASGVEDDPQIYNLDTGVYSGNYDSFDYNDRGRLGWTASYTRVLSNSMGEHKVKGGVEQWMLTDTRELIYTGPEGGVQYISSPDSGLPCTAPAYDDCFGYTAFDEVGPLGHTGQLFSGYLQDDWSPVEALTMNVGVRADHEALYSNDGNLFVEAWMFSPRTGLAWDLTGDNKTLLSFNFGRYYDVQGNTFADWGDTRSAYSYREYRYNADSGGYDLVWVQDPSGVPADVAEDLTPFHMDKIALGFEREVLPMFSLGVRGILSKTVDLPEDIDLDGSAFLIDNPDNKWRDYRALEITAEKKFSDGWLLLASYTLSESKGHMPGQFEQSSGGEFGSDGNNVGVYLDDVNDMAYREELFNSGYGGFLQGLAGLGTLTDDAGYYGYLPYHSFHAIKVNGSYTFDLARFDLTPGLIYEFDSGHAWQKRGYVDLYGDYYAFPEGRGSRSMPAVHYLDMKVAAEIPIREAQSVELALEIFNLPDFAQAVTYYENDDENFGLTLYRQAPRSVRASLQFNY